MNTKLAGHKKHLLVAAVITALVLSGWGWMEMRFLNRALPGLKVLGINIGDKTRDEIIEIINQKYDQATANGLRFVYKNRAATIYPEVMAANDPDLFYQLFKVNVEQTADELLKFGHTNNPFLDIPAIIQTLTVGVNRQVNYTIFSNALITALKENFGDLEHPAKNPELHYRNNQIEFSDSATGVSFNFHNVAEKLRDQIANLNFQTTELALSPDEPTVTVDEVAPLGEKIKKLADSLPLTLEFGGRQWFIYRRDFLDWLDFKKDDDGTTSLTLKTDAIFKFLQNIAKSVEERPVDAKFKIENGKVSEFQSSKNGQAMDYEKTENDLSKILLDENKKPAVTLAISTIIIDPRVTTANINTLGIKELLGVGKSNFKGSPANRLHNITTGANALNGTLIAPDEEFSLLKILGKITEETGYLPELVIKGNKTTKEFGGGLCQIGTTIFRAAIASGLPITQRQNHSYRVPYYEPAGTDATIYDPSPDFRFSNDTGNYLLIQTKIVGQDLIFEIWGTKDGRLAEQTAPTVYNIIPPEPPLLTQTEDLPVGIKKCTERAHEGADAKFTYTVTYQDGKKVVKEFKSHYKPWREVCLIGVLKGTLPKEAEGAGLPSADAAGAAAR